jgi:hypothetical protein
LAAEPSAVSEKEIAKARGRLEGLLGKHGLLLVHDAKLPSATACIAGGPVPGSWWGHAQGKLIYETLERIEETVAWAKLVLGKDTLVHRRLWPALVAAAESGQEWQTRGLKADAKRLLARIRRGGPVRTDEAPRAAGRKLGAVATELERRLLAHSRSEHTASGHHARFLETWGAWGRGRGVAAADLPDAAGAIVALSAPVLAWTGGRRPAGLLPWYGDG